MNPLHTHSGGHGPEYSNLDHRALSSGMPVAVRVVVA
jgi:hypothetical protein